jgi:hypothetical protein
MPNWIEITADQLIDAKAAPLVAQLRNAVLADGQSDPVDDHLAAGIAQVRNAIGSSGKFLLDARLAAVPLALKFLTLRCVLRSMQSRLNAVGALELSETEQKEWDKDDAILKAIAAGDLAVEIPDIPLQTPTTQSKAGRPRISERPLNFTRGHQDGII